MAATAGAAAALLLAALGTAAAVNALTPDDPTLSTPARPGKVPVGYRDAAGQRVERMVDDIHGRIVDFERLRFTTSRGDIAYFVGPAIAAVPETTCILRVEPFEAASACSDDADVRATGLFIHGDTGGGWYLPGATAVMPSGERLTPEGGTFTWGPGQRGRITATLQTGRTVTEELPAAPR
ncbi:MAG: hypothetical protein IT200_04770 [Thermoleophilia bacterium]|nr:hypothetical protein [Thermoleophilia bacterium]